MTATEQINALAEGWGGFMLRGLIEATILLLIVTSIWLLFRKRISAQLSCGLFSLVLLKLAVPLPIVVPSWCLMFSPVTAAEKLADWERMAEPDARLDPSEIPVARSPSVEGTGLGSRPPTTRAIPIAAAPDAHPLSSLALLMIGWGMVVSGLLAVFVARHLAMHLKLKGARRLEKTELSIDVGALARSVGLRGPVRVSEVPRLVSPAVWGLGRTCILLPPGIGASLSANEMTWVLLHELIHIRRRDTWVVTFQRLIQMVYFFHPAVWLANRMIDAQREYACDDAAIAVSGVPRRDCGTGFLSIVKRAASLPMTECPALGMIRSKSLIRKRLMRILDDQRPLRVRLSFGSAALLIALGGLVLPRLQARDAHPSPRDARPELESSTARESTLVSQNTKVREQAKSAPAAFKPVNGIVRDRDGRGIEHVAITATLRFREIDFTNGVLEDVGDRPFTWTTSGGRFRMPPQDDRYRVHEESPGFGVFAYHDKGYARKSADELAKSADFTLEPWGRVEGIVTVLGKPLANVPLRFTLDATDQHSMFYDVYEYDCQTDGQGRYSVDHVPAGVAHLSTGTRFGKDAGPDGMLSSAWRPIRAGETLTLNIGGSGRPVEGKLLVREGIPVNLGGGSLALKTNQSPEPPKLSDEEMKRMSLGERFSYYFDAYRSPQGLARRLAQRFHSVRIRPDGTFRAAEVEPGTYVLSFWAGEDFQHPLVTREVVVPPIAEGQRDVPLEVGTVEIKPPGTT